LPLKLKKSAGTGIRTLDFIVRVFFARFINSKNGAASFKVSIMKRVRHDAAENSAECQIKGKEYKFQNLRNSSFSSFVILVFARHIFKVEARVKGKRTTTSYNSNSNASAAYIQILLIDPTF
jgi:hypothetical protein